MISTCFHLSSRCKKKIAVEANRTLLSYNKCIRAVKGFQNNHKMELLILKRGRNILRNLYGNGFKMVPKRHDDQGPK